MRGAEKFLAKLKLECAGWSPEVCLPMLAAKLPTQLS
jgi:hypothetical protein